jgi:hypothetical protein
MSDMIGRNAGTIGAARMPRWFAMFPLGSWDALVGKAAGRRLAGCSTGGVWYRCANSRYLGASFDVHPFCPFSSARFRRPDTRFKSWFPKYWLGIQWGIPFHGHSGITRI